MIAAFLGGGEILLVMMMFFIIPIALVAFVFWIWMLVDAIQNKGLTDGEKIAWVLVIALLHALGALVYFIVGHPKRKTPLAT